MTASVPAPTANAVQFASPLKIAVAMAHNSRSGPVFSTEKPNNFGTWLMRTGRHLVPVGS